MKHWNGDYGFALRNLVLKDFRIRYRNMSLGVFWSLLNPLIMAIVLSYVFTVVFPNRNIPTYPVYLLCGLIPFNFFALAWASGTSSLLENSSMIKRVPVPREIVPIASVLSNGLHLLIQFVLLLAFIFYYRYTINIQWLWLPVVWALELLFVTGMVMACSALMVYVRDMRYIVESCTTILFYLVPIFYSTQDVPEAYLPLYDYNPVAALVLALRRIFMEARAPGASLLIKLALVSVFVHVLGWWIFRRLKTRFYDYL